MRLIRLLVFILIAILIGGLFGCASEETRGLTQNEYNYISCISNYRSQTNGVADLGRASVVCNHFLMEAR
jgi:hypothetical protein